MIWKPLVYVCAAAALLSGGRVLAGCSGIEGGVEEAEKSGTAPIAVNLKILSGGTGNRLGGQAVLVGRFTFHDDDGDVYARASRITLPSGVSHEPTPANIGGMQPGTTDGEFEFTTEIIELPEIGTYTLEMWVLDQGYNESNRLSTTFEVTQ